MRVLRRLPQTWLRPLCLLACLAIAPLSAVKRACAPHAYKVIRSCCACANSAASMQAHAGLRSWVGGCGGVAAARTCFADAAVPRALRHEAASLLHALCLDCPLNMDAFEEQNVVELIVAEARSRRDIEPLAPCHFTIEVFSLAWTAILARAAVMKAFLLADGAMCCLCSFTHLQM